jgi:uncharacterized Zn finger protein
MRKKQSFDYDDDLETRRCPECGSDNLFAEVINSREWIGNREVDTSVTRYTCLNEACGYFWEVK